MNTQQIIDASIRLSGINLVNQLQINSRLSTEFQCQVYLKREDLQMIRSYKIRGAYNKISSLNQKEAAQGIVSVSAGNHAQGVAFTSSELCIHADIFMPANTPAQKIGHVKKWGGNQVSIHLIGDTYDDCYEDACKYADEAGKPLIHPFDDEQVIAGQGTIGKEITEYLAEIDFVFVPVGGGGLAAGIGAWFSEKSPKTQLVAVEPAGAASLSIAMETGRPVELDHIDSFVDGAAVKKIGALNFPIIQRSFHGIHTVPEGKVCETLLQLYNEDAIIAEPAGALTIAALEDYATQIKGKNVVCIVSGGNNDFRRMEEIRKLSDAWQGLHHHLIIRFKHYPDGLTQLFTEILGGDNYVTRMEYKRREHGRSTYALVGIKSSTHEEYQRVLIKLNKLEMEYQEVSKNDFLFKYWV